MRRKDFFCRPIFYIFLALNLVFINNLTIKGQTHLPKDLHLQLSELKKESLFDDALELIDHHIDNYRSDNNTYALLEAKLQKADLLRMIGYSRQSAEFLDTMASNDFAEIDPDDVLFAQFYTIRGTIHLIQGELEEGRINIVKAIDIYSTNPGSEDTVLGPCYNKLGNYYYFKKDFDSAMFYYSNALKLAQKKKRNLEDRASYIQNIGIIHLEQGNYGESESCFLESLRLKEEIYPLNSYSLGRIYLNIGRFYQSISAFNKSFQYLTKSENIFNIKGVPAHVELGKIYWNKGLIYFLTGDYEMAITYLFNARQIIDTVFADNKQLLSALHSDIGNVYYFSGQDDKAIYYYQLAASGIGNQLDLKTCRSLANLYQRKGDYQQAKEYYNIALSRAQHTGMKGCQESALTYIYYGEFLMHSGNDSALYYLDKAVDILNDGSGFHTKELAASYYNIGEFYFKKEQLYKAIRFTQKSLETISGTCGDTILIHNPEKHSLKPDNLSINALFKKALYLSHYYNEVQNEDYLVAAGKTYLLCLDIIDQTKMRYRADECQTILPGDIYTIYHHAIDLFMILYAHSNNKEWLYQAFRTSERGKSMALLTRYKEAHAKKIGSIPEEINKAEKNIISNLNLFRNNIWEEENKEVVDSKKLIYLRSNQLKFEIKYDSLIDHLKRFYPDYYQLKYDHSVVTVENLQHALDDNEVLLEYTLADTSLFLFLVTPNHFEVIKKSIDTTLIDDIFALRENLDFNHVHEYSHQDYMNYQYKAFKLYDVLIKPVENFITDKKLIIIPDEELSYLSFESLVQRIMPYDSINFRQLPYLLKVCPVSYAASSTVFSFVKKGRGPVLSRGVLALAPSTSIVTRNFLAQNQKLADVLNYKQELPGATWETENILKIMKGKKLIGDEATESEFKKLSSNYDILHFATHTHIDNENPLSSMLSFYPYDTDGEDGVLHTYEIYNLDLDGELAVLSACSTGNGKLQKGEGVISLARAFSYAGMPSVVMTLWNVEDISSGNIIPSFYHILKLGTDKDIALQTAKLNYIETTNKEIETHPAFWSGFVLYGNSRGFRHEGYRKYLFLLFVLGSLIIFISFVLVRRYIAFRKKFKRISVDLSKELQPKDRI